MSDIILPELGEGIGEATVACWHMSIGDKVEQDDDIVEVVTDKASFNIPSPAAGIIKEICVDPGVTVQIGSVLARIEP